MENVVVPPKSEFEENVPSPVNVCIVYPPDVVTVPPVAFCVEPEYRTITMPEPPAPPEPLLL
jgi:hypothetical protein